MKVVTVFISIEDGQPPYSYAEVEVPGLGLVSTKDCVSNGARAEIFEDVAKHVELLLRNGQKDANQDK